MKNKEIKTIFKIPLQTIYNWREVEEGDWRRNILKLLYSLDPKEAMRVLENKVNIHFHKDEKNISITSNINLSHDEYILDRNGDDEISYLYIGKDDYDDFLKLFILNNHIILTDDTPIIKWKNFTIKAPQAEFIKVYKEARNV
jgi:hypothetical protein